MACRQLKYPCVSEKEICILYMLFDSYRGTSKFINSTLKVFINRSFLGYFDILKDLCFKSCERNYTLFLWKSNLQIYYLKGKVRSKNKLRSNERAWKMQNNEPSLTSMCLMVLEITPVKVRNLSKMDVAIL